MSWDPVDRLLSSCYICHIVWLPDKSGRPIKICEDCGNPTVPEHNETRVN